MNTMLKQILAVVSISATLAMTASVHADTHTDVPLWKELKARNSGADTSPVEKSTKGTPLWQQIKDGTLPEKKERSWKDDWKVVAHFDKQDGKVFVTSALTNEQGDNSFTLLCDNESETPYLFYFNGNTYRYTDIIIDNHHLTITPDVSENNIMLSKSSNKSGFEQLHNRLIAGNTLRIASAKFDISMYKEGYAQLIKECIDF